MTVKDPSGMWQIMADTETKMDSRGKVKRRETTLIMPVPGGHVIRVVTDQPGRFAQSMVFVPMPEAPPMEKPKPAPKKAAPKKKAAQPKTKPTQKENA